MAKKADEISIAEILQALGEPVIFGSCQTEKGCENAITCPTFSLWRKVKGSIDEILETTTLADIVDERMALLENLNSDREREQARDRAISARESKEE